MGVYICSGGRGGLPRGTWAFHLECAWQTHDLDHMTVALGVAGFPLFLNVEHSIHESISSSR